MPSQPIDAAAELDNNNAEVKDIGSFDYTAPAELFPTRSRKGNRPMGYRRFAKAADAIRFAIEELSPELLIGAHLEVNEERFNCDEIRRLYEHTERAMRRRRQHANNMAASKPNANHAVELSESKSLV